MKKVAVALAGIMMLFGLGATAHAQYGTPPTVTVSPTNPAPGGSYTVNVAGCMPNEMATVVVGGASSMVMADAMGNVVVNLTAPAAAGVINGSVTCNGATTNFTVAVGAVPPTNGGGDGGGGLPATGSDGQQSMLVVALGLLVVGLGVLGVSQVRRRTTIA